MEAEFAAARLAIAAAGGLILGVVLAIRAFDWLRDVIEMRSDQRYEDDRDSRRN
jgi:hypothetical protein